MSHGTALAWLSAAAASLALTAGASAQTGQSPNGPPGPEGNPNPPQAEAPAVSQTPAKQQSAPNGKAKGHAKPRPKPKSRANSKSKSKSNQRNPNPGTPRKGGREDRPAGKITICHATHSDTNPYSEITISVNGLNGHGHHHAKEGARDDIIPAPSGGCPGAAPAAQQSTAAPQAAAVAAPAPERVAAQASASGVLGAQASGGDEPGGVLGASAAGGDDAPAEARATRSARVGSLPFTGLELAFLVIAGIAALLGGVALRRALGAGA